MDHSLKLHDDVVRGALKELHGYEVKSEGGAFMLAFASPVEAARCCIKIQYALLDVDWPAELYGNPESTFEIDEQ